MEKCMSSFECYGKLVRCMRTRVKRKEIIMFREVKRITDAISSWCMNVGLIVETSYRGDSQMLTLVFKLNVRDEQPYTMKFDLGMPSITTEWIIDRIKKDVKEHYGIRELVNNRFEYPEWLRKSFVYSDLYGEKRRIPTIKDVIFNGPATIVIWGDNTKTVVKCQEGDTLDPEKGLAMAIAKKALGNKGNFNDEFKKWINE